MGFGLAKDKTQTCPPLHLRLVLVAQIQDFSFWYIFMHWMWHRFSPTMLKFKWKIKWFSSSRLNCVKYNERLWTNLFFFKNKWLICYSSNKFRPNSTKFWNLGVRERERKKCRERKWRAGPISTAKPCDVVMICGVEFAVVGPTVYVPCILRNGHISFLSLRFPGWNDFTQMTLVFHACFGDHVIWELVNLAENSRDGERNLPTTRLHL